MDHVFYGPAHAARHFSHVLQNSWNKAASSGV
jgi:hypothetical protein